MISEPRVGERPAWTLTYIMCVELESCHKNAIEADICLSRWSARVFLIANGFGLINYGRLVLSLLSRLQVTWKTEEEQQPSPLPPSRCVDSEPRVWRWMSRAAGSQRCNQGRFRLTAATCSTSPCPKKNVTGNNNLSSVGIDGIVIKESDRLL